MTDHQQRNPFRTSGTLPPFAASWPIHFCSKEEQSRPRDLLRSLLPRGWEKPAETGRLEWQMGQGTSLEMLTAGVAHKLRLISEAEWIAVAADNKHHWQLRAEVSRGVNYVVEVWHFEKDPPASVRLLGSLRVPLFINGNLVDGGDVVVAISENKAFIFDQVRAV